MDDTTPNPTLPASRRLAAILAADMVGYSAQIGADEAGTLERLRSIRIELIDPVLLANHGRLVKTMGDGFLVEFTSIVDALCCAREWQAAMVERNSQIAFRIGIAVGDILVESDGDIFGDTVNVAARLEGLAKPGSICVSARVREDSVGKVDLNFIDMGEHYLKNIAQPVHVYMVNLDLPMIIPSENLDAHQREFLHRQHVRQIEQQEIDQKREDQNLEIKHLQQDLIQRHEKEDLELKHAAEKLEPEPELESEPEPESEPILETNEVFYIKRS